MGKKKPKARKWKMKVEEAVGGASFPSPAPYRTVPGFKTSLPALSMVILKD